MTGKREIRHLQDSSAKTVKSHSSGKILVKTKYTYSINEMYFCFRYGRRIIILIGLAVQAIFGVGAAFAPNFYIYVMLRFVVGMTVSAVIMNAFVLGE